MPSGNIARRRPDVPEHFRVFSDGRGHWCADKDDGSVAGIFFSRDAALRFARKEGYHESGPNSGSVAPVSTPRRAS
jgi:hypothetical protein